MNVIQFIYTYIMTEIFSYLEVFEPHTYFIFLLYFYKAMKCLIMSSTHFINLPAVHIF